MSVTRKVIQAPDSTGSEISRRVPQDGTASMSMGSVCVVEDSQVGIFFRDGQTFDVLGPGRHVLSPTNLPLLVDSLSTPRGRKASFQAAVYFVSQRVYTGMRWGTRQPLTVRDCELGDVPLRASGVYTMRVADSALFLNTVTGAQGMFMSQHMEEYLQEVIVTRLDHLMGERVTSLLELPTLYNELATEARLELKQDFERCGIDLIDFFITSVVPTEEVQRAIDHRAEADHGHDSDSGVYRKYQADRALSRPRVGAGDANKDAGAGPGLGVGEGMGFILPQAFQGSSAGHTGTECPYCGSTRESGEACTSCRQEVPRGASFCPKCGANQGKQASG